MQCLLQANIWSAYCPCITNSQQLSKTTGALIPEVSTSGRKAHLVTNHHGWSSIPGGSSVHAYVCSPSLSLSPHSVSIVENKIVFWIPGSFFAVVWKSYILTTHCLHQPELPQTNLTSNYTVWIPQLTLSKRYLIFRPSFPIDVLLLKNISPPNFIPHLPFIFFKKKYLLPNIHEETFYILPLYTVSNLQLIFKNTQLSN